MPARNSQNPIRASKTFEHMGKKPGDGLIPGSKEHGNGTLYCSTCNIDIPSRPGFRPSALKCPKCGGPSSKR